MVLGTIILSNGKGHFWFDWPSKVVPDIPFGPNRNGLFHLISNRNFRNFGLNGKRPWSRLFTDTAAILNLLDLRSIMGCPEGTRSVFTRAFRAKRELQCIFLGKKAIIITSKHGTTISFSHYNLFLVNTVRVYRIVLIYNYICKPDEGWYGQPKYCYEKTIHVVLNQLCSSLWTSRFWFLIFWLIRFLF